MTSDTPGTGERIAQRQSWQEGNDQAVKAAIRKIEAESKERFGAESHRELGRIRSKNTLL